jgi:hypothetical protein
VGDQHSDGRSDPQGEARIVDFTVTHVFPNAGWVGS